MKSLGGFWKDILPELADQYGFGNKLSAGSKVAEWEKGVAKAIKKMDGEEFNLFLAQVVIKASGKQVMGVNLTEQIQALKELRK